MNKTLKLINNIIGGKNLNGNAAILYNTHLQDITKISNSIIDESEDNKLRNLKLIEISKLPESATKFKLLDILQNDL